MSKDFFYVKADPLHFDLQDLFKGKYNKEKGMWKFDKQYEEQVYTFLQSESSESDKSDENIFKSDAEKNSDSDDSTKKSTVKKHKRFHRARSFDVMAGDSTDEERDSLDRNYRRSRKHEKEIVKDEENIESDSDSKS